jgi:hypothetical protein
VVTDGIIGCPHEEGTDYPEGASCPQCPYWAGRDRFTHERIQWAIPERRRLNHSTSTSTICSLALKVRSSSSPSLCKTDHPWCGFETTVGACHRNFLRY